MKKVLLGAVVAAFFASSAPAFAGEICSQKPDPESLRILLQGEPNFTSNNFKQPSFSVKVVEGKYTAYSPEVSSLAITFNPDFQNGCAFLQTSDKDKYTMCFCKKEEAKDSPLIVAKIMSYGSTFVKFVWDVIPANPNK